VSPRNAATKPKTVKPAPPEFDLGVFEGEKVIGSTVSLRNAGDGLSDAMQVEPVIMHKGDTGYIVVAYEVAEIAFPPPKGKRKGVVNRKHVLTATHSALVTEEYAAEAIAKSRAHIAAMRNSGEQMLDENSQVKAPAEEDIAAVGDDQGDED